MPRPSQGLRYGCTDSPVGVLLVAGDGQRLRLIRFPSESRAKPPPPDWRRDDALFDQAFLQLGAYFAGELTRFSLDLCLSGSAFQNTVWAALRDIPYGATTSYGALAARIGKPNASRAVGRANATNPLPIVIPCHRVVGADRSLTGFGGGIEIKRFLLEHERRHGAVASPEGELPI